MKMKFSTIAMAALMGFSMQAHALIDNGSTGNGELFLSVWDSTNNTSYTRGLGMAMNTFLGNAGVVTGANAAAFTASGDTSANNYSLAADANMTSFLAGVAPTDTVQWNVVAYDTTGLGYAARRFLFTSNSGLSNVALTTNQQTASMTIGAGSYLAGVNSLMPAGSANFDKASIATSLAAGAAAYPGYPGNGFGNNMGSFLQYGTTTAALGQNLAFYFLTPSTTTGTAYSTAYQFQNANGTSNWTLGTNGTLTYTTASVAAVPEPSEIGLMLSGFGLVGFLANKRRKALKG